MSKRKGWNHRAGLGNPPAVVKPKPTVIPRDVADQLLLDKVDAAFRGSNERIYHSEKTLIQLSEILSQGLGYRVEEFHIEVPISKISDAKRLRLFWSRDGRFGSRGTRSKQGS